jgi:hypothetical protein
MIEITTEQIERINLILHGIPGGVSKALNAVIQRGVSALRSNALNEITKVYTITKKDVRAESNIKISRVYSKDSNSGVIGTIEYAGASIPLIRFGAKSSGSKGVYARQMKSSGRELFRHAFIAKMKSGHIGMFERVNDNYMKSRKGQTKHSQMIGYNGSKKYYDQFYGSSVAHMLNNPGVKAELEKKVQETIDKRIEHEIHRILKGYGGK